MYLKIRGPLERKNQRCIFFVFLPKLDRQGARASMLAPSSSGGAIGGSAGEVVGCGGRIGSLLLRAGDGTLAATPRGVAPGGLSPPGTPLIVATPASALPEVLLATPPERRADLFVLSNGMARETVR